MTHILKLRNRLLFQDVFHLFLNNFQGNVSKSSLYSIISLFYSSHPHPRVAWERYACISCHENCLCTNQRRNFHYSIKRFQLNDSNESSESNESSGKNNFREKKRQSEIKNLNNKSRNKPNQNTNYNENNNENYYENQNTNQNTNYNENYKKYNSKKEIKNEGSSTYNYKKVNLPNESQYKFKVNKESNSLSNEARMIVDRAQRLASSVKKKFKNRESIKETTSQPPQSSQTSQNFKSSKSPAFDSIQLNESTSRNSQRAILQSSDEINLEENSSYLETLNSHLNYNVTSLDKQFVEMKPNFVYNEKEEFLPHVQTHFIKERTKHPVDNFNLFTDEDTLELMNDRYTYPLQRNHFFNQSRNILLSIIKFQWNDETNDDNLEIQAAKCGYIWQIPWNRSIRLLRLTLRRIEMIDEVEKQRIKTEWRQSFAQSTNSGFQQKQVESNIQNGMKIANYYIKKYAKKSYSPKEIEQALIREIDLPLPPVKPAESSSDESVPLYNELFL